MVLGLAVSPADGLSGMLWYVGLGRGYQAALGPVQQRFAFVLIQTFAAEILRHLSSECRAEGGVERIWPQT